jgi:hypothetical protein
LQRFSAFLLLATLFLLPWGGLLRVAPLHENAQWSDLVFAAAALAWAASLALERRLPRLRLVHAGLALYLGWATLSYLAAEPRPAAGLTKLLGMGMLAGLLVITSDLVALPGRPAAVGRTIAATSLLTALAAIVGVALSLGGRLTPLVGTCGDLVQGPLGRPQAGFPHPNLLASWCVFAAGVTARADAGLPKRLRALLQVALGVTVLLTFSRAILAFALSLAIRHATTPARRRIAWAAAGAAVVVMVALTAGNLLLDPTRPWAARFSPEPSSRLEAATTSLATLERQPLFGIGPGLSPGWRGTMPFDAHLTPLNVAATLGLPALAGLALLVAALWRARARPTDLVTWGLLAGLALDGLGQDVEDFRHVWVALGLADAGREGV